MERKYYKVKYILEDSVVHTSIITPELIPGEPVHGDFVSVTRNNPPSPEFSPRWYQVFARLWLEGDDNFLGTIVHAVKLVPLDQANGLDVMVNAQ